MGGDEEIMELLWHNGQVVMQSQNQRSKKPDTGEMEPTRPSDHVFMHEDETASWLQYPLDDNPLENYMYGTGTGLIPATAPVTVAPPYVPPPQPIPSRPLVPPNRRLEVEQKYTNFGHFTRPSWRKITSESQASRVSDKLAAVGLGGAAGREMETCEMSVTSSGGSGGSASMEPLSEKPPPVTDERKRKGVGADDNEGHSKDVEFDYADGQKQSHAGSTSTKRSRAAEVHNLSERRRRDRINEKMKALQELIPRCNKSDKASMLDEAIEYLKSLQMQVQMISMGCNMVPMMFAGVQQYVPPMAMGMGVGMGMGMGMGMDMGMNRAMVPYPTIHQGSSLPNPVAAAHLGQRFPIPGFNMSPVTIARPTTNQVTNMSDQMMNTLTLNSQNQARVPNFAGPFQHYLGLHQTQLPFPQNQGGVPPTTTTPSSNRDVTNPNHKQTG